MNLNRRCGHGVSLDARCLACEMMWRIEERIETKLARYETALLTIAKCESHAEGDVVDIARQALRLARPGR